MCLRHTEWPHEYLPVLIGDTHQEYLLHRPLRLTSLIQAQQLPESANNRLSKHYFRI